MPFYSWESHSHRPADCLLASLKVVQMPMFPISMLFHDYLPSMRRPYNHTLQENTPYHRNRQHDLPNKNGCFLGAPHCRWAAITCHKSCLFPFKELGAICKYANMFSSVTVPFQRSFFINFFLIHKSSCIFLRYISDYVD